MLLMDGLSCILRSCLVGKERGIASWFVRHAPIIVSPPVSPRPAIPFSAGDLPRPAHALVNLLSLGAG